MNTVWSVSDAIEVAEAAAEVNPVVYMLVGAFVGILASGLPFYIQLRRLKSLVEETEAETGVHKADAAMTITTAARSLIEPLSARVGELETRVEDLEDHIDILEALMKERGLTPPNRPLHPSTRRP